MGHFRTKNGPLPYMLACLMFLGSTAPFPANAEDLNDEALRELALQGAWEAEHAEYGFWAWSSDGTVCLKLGSPDADCADTGRYEISDHVLCYELSWWGETAGERKTCFTVRQLADNRFETVFSGTAMTSRMFAFKVLQ